LNIQIRNETSDDVEQIHQVTELVFLDAPHTDYTEQFIVKALRKSDALVVSLVAEADWEIIGHVAVSPVNISDGATNWYGLGPISVLPDHQGKGVGTQLMKNVLADIESKGASGCVVLGDPGYYGCFGFKAVKGLFFPGDPSEYFHAVSFDAGFAQGEVTYHDAFSAQG